MANITAADVKRLRDATAAGMLDCKKALEEAGGDFDAAVEILRVKGAKDVGKRAGRVAANGLVTALLDGTRAGILVELNCETDFVAKTELFQQVAADIAAGALAHRPADRLTLLGTEVRPGVTAQQLIDEAGASLQEKLELGRYALLEGGYVTSYLHRSDRALPPTLGVLVQLDAPAEETAREEGKPEAALPKIVDGRVNAFFKDFVLIEQASVSDNKKTVKQVLADAGLTVTRFIRFEVGQA